jgi:hypothetical protein
MDPVTRRVELQILWAEIRARKVEQKGPRVRAAGVARRTHVRLT